MRQIFVFGSNLAGRHGKGAALYAVKEHGAEYGVGEGPQGNSYAIPTKDKKLSTLPLYEIREAIYRFVEYAWDNDDLFVVTPIGTGLAGHSHKDIASLFQEHQLPPNIVFTSTWFDKEWWNKNV